MKSNKIRKAVLPVAGWGTRWLPATKNMPKELLPVGDRPLIHHVADEASSSGVDQLLFIISEGKESIAEYFKEDPQLKQYLATKGKEEVMKEWRTLSSSISVSQELQLQARGLGDAISYAEEFTAGEAFAVLLPDDLVFGTRPCIKQLMAVHETYGGAVLALERIPRSEISRYGVISGEEVKPGIFRVTGMVEKPSPDEAPSDLAVIGRYILPPDIFTALRDLPPGAGGEIQLTDAIARLIPGPGVMGLVFEGTRFDAGHPLGWLLTNLKYFSEDPRFSSHPLLSNLSQDL